MADRPTIVPFKRPEPEPEMVAAIEELLFRAKAGEVEYLVWIEETPAGVPDCGEAGSLNAAMVAGRLLRLANLYAMEDDGEDDE